MRVYEAIYTTAFLRDFAKCEKKHWSMAALEKAIEDLMLSDEEALVPSYKDHVLSGNWKGYREIHVGGRTSDWILIYLISDREIYLARTGTHDELFK